MKPETGERVEKAEGDYRTASREARVAHDPNMDAACFHCQQCAEKYLKALLVEAGVGFPRVHDLEALLNLTLRIDPGLEQIRAGLQDLTDMAVEIRYPGFFARSEDVTAALAAAAETRDAIRKSLLLAP